MVAIGIPQRRVPRILVELAMLLWEIRGNVRRMQSKANNQEGFTVRRLPDMELRRIRNDQLTYKGRMRIVSSGHFFFRFQILRDLKFEI